MTLPTGRRRHAEGDDGIGGRRHAQTPRTSLRRSVRRNTGSISDSSQKAAEGAGKRRTERHGDEPVEQFTYDTSHGYPKGLPDGVKIRVRIDGHDRIIHGVPYEEMDEELQKDLDEKPLDDAGQIRVFVPDSFLGSGSYIEFGSTEHAKKFMKSLQENGKRLL